MKRIWAPWRIDFILHAREKRSACILCELPKKGVGEESLVLKTSAHSYLVMNRYPYNAGHLMIVPMLHTKSFDGFSDDALLDIHRMIREGIKVLSKTMQPDGFNVGMNMGESGGAGIPDHLHYHIVPRWTGDTNYLPVLGETRVLPETLEDTYRRLLPNLG